MIDASRLLTDCQRLVRTLEKDLRERLSERPDLEAQVKGEYERAKAGNRTGQSYSEWSDDYLTQVAVHWVLAAVFVRFLEDSGLLPEPWLAGPGARLEQARDRHERFFAAQPSASDREYLLACFRDVERLPAMAPLFDERHNPLFRLGPTADGAAEILKLFRRLDGEGELVHNFEDPEWGTRFLGDLYQDLSESARRRYALLQTPEFVEEFILDRTLEPAMEELGYQNVKLIDPACGSGHFLLGAFHRLFDRWQRAEPGTNERELARRALEQISGVDLNPFAVAIARFRLLIAALKVSNIKRIAEAPAFPLNLAAGDSLLHGPRPGDISGRNRYLFGEDPLAYVYQSEDVEELRRLLGQQYQVVVGNPPYITPKDLILNQEYRRFGSCRGKYSLAVPFTERFFDLASFPDVGRPHTAGWVGMITSNSFMKRTFGKKLIEHYIPKWDLTHVIDTSGAYIPGHGTPTVMLIGRNRPPLNDAIRTVMSIKGEPNIPKDPSQAFVWTAILRQIDNPGSLSEFVSVDDYSRARFHTHPWSLGGGGASELKDLVERNEKTLGNHVMSIGFASFTGTDEAFVADTSTLLRKDIELAKVRSFVFGEAIRDWAISSELSAITPYDSNLEALPIDISAQWYRYLWTFRTSIGGVLSFGGKTRSELSDPWWTWYRWVPEKYRTPLSITFAFVATHNHFALDRGGKVFNRSAPVIKLADGAGEDDHIALVALLNSSLACFWMRQVFQPKEGSGIGRGIQPEEWMERFEFDCTKIRQFPLTHERPVAFAKELDRLAQERSESLARAWLERYLPSRPALDETRRRIEHIEKQMVALQEELDWQVYHLYGLLESPLEADISAFSEVALGARPFEILLARRMASGEEESQWFERHGSTPITEIPSHWPEPYRRVVEKRIEAIENNQWIALIERPEYKRRWKREPWEEQEKRALRDWLLDRLEDKRYWPESLLTSAGRLADQLRSDPEFRQVASLYRGRDDFDWTELITELVLDEGVPFLAGYRYTESGIRKRAEWEETWRLQRLDDAIDDRTKLPAGHSERLTEEQAKTVKAQEVGTTPVPPRYAPTDFRKQSYWRLRGKLDVPKERFILYPGLERAADRAPVLGWAGWNHLEQAHALGRAFQELRENEGWGKDKLASLLAGLQELVPWLLQWHNEPDPAFAGQRLGDFYAGFVEEQARALGLTREELAAPPELAKATRGRKKKAS